MLGCIAYYVGEKDDEEERKEKEVRYWKARDEIRGFYMPSDENLHKIIEENTGVRKAFQEMVPSKMDELTFWTQYCRAEYTKNVPEGDYAEEEGGGGGLAFFEDMASKALAEEKKERMDKDDRDKDKDQAPTVGQLWENCQFLENRRLERFTQRLATLEDGPKFATLAKRLGENPPVVEEGDLVHIFSDDSQRPNFLVEVAKNKDPNALQAVPLAIVTKASTCGWRLADGFEEDPEGDIRVVAVRRLELGFDGAHRESVQEERIIPISLFPKWASCDVIHEWSTPSEQRRTPTDLRKMTFGVPFVDSTVLTKYGGGNLYLTAKSSLGPDMKTSRRLCDDDFALQVWSYESGMLFRMDDELLLQTNGERGNAFAKDANPPDGNGSLLLLALRTFKYDLATGEPCSYQRGDNNALHVIMAYVTTKRDAGAYAKCKKEGKDIDGPDGPIVFELPFRKLSFPKEYDFLGGGKDEYGYAKEIVYDVLTRMVEMNSCGAPASLDIALNQGSPLKPFGGTTPLVDLLKFTSEVSALVWLLSTNPIETLHKPNRNPTQTFTNVHERSLSFTNVHFPSLSFTFVHEPSRTLLKP